MNIFKQVAAKNLNIKEFPFFSELNIEAYIIENPQILSSDELSNPEIINSQIYLHAGRKVGDGRIDLLAKTDNDILLVIEIKKGKLNLNHLQQLEDYLSEFNKNKIKIMKDVDPNNDYSNFQLKGIIVGLDIESVIKEKISNGYSVGDAEIYGLTINRFTTSDSSENYIITDMFVPKSSSLTRYNDWDEYAKKQNQSGISKEIVSVGKRIHDDFVNLYHLSKENIKYTPTTYTLNVPVSQRKRVFAYVIMRKNDIKIYLNNNGICPPGAYPHERLDRYPNTHYILIKNETDYNDNVKEMISDSYEVIINYYK